MVFDREGETQEHKRESGDVGEKEWIEKRQAGTMLMVLCTFTAEGDLFQIHIECFGEESIRKQLLRE